MHTEHIKYDLMDYITNRLNAQERKRVEEHLQKCPKCNNQYAELSATDAVLKRNHSTAPTSVYYSTILPRVRERIFFHKRSIWDYSYGTVKIFIPIAVSILLVFFLIRIPTESSSEAAQTEALHQAVKDLDEDEIVQAVEKEYAGLSISPNQEVAAAGVAEHLQGDRFLKSAISKQIENEEVTEMDIEGMISDLDGEQVDQVLSGLSERNIL
ncbi:MAG: zf-HC2 domain-containing protein [Bacteroidota bacterium]